MQSIQVGQLLSRELAQDAPTLMIITNSLPDNEAGIESGIESASSNKEEAAFLDREIELAPAKLSVHTS
jgi:hypothetical protein